MLVDAVKFPPIGDRGLDNAGMDSDFKTHDVDKYVAWANRETFLTVQVETPEGVRNAEAIAAVEGVDMIFIGPGDLGFRLRQSGEMTLDDAWQIVAAACKKHGKAFGGATAHVAEMKQRRRLGAQLLVGNNESQNWRTGLADNVKLFDGLDSPGP
jgi:2-keto-3-deoxy-L-rhamnonate aldolase RhmA